MDFPRTQAPWGSDGVGIGSPNHVGVAPPLLLTTSVDGGFLQGSRTWPDVPPPRSAGSRKYLVLARQQLSRSSTLLSIILHLDIVDQTVALSACIKHRTSLCTIH